MALRHHNPEHLTFVEDPDALAALCDRLRTARQIALDTESASFHRYVDRVYLVQVSSHEETALVDPLEVPNLDPIGSVLENPHIEIILHDADYDLRVLNRDYGFRARNLFDTRLAAQLAGEESVGLGSLLEKHLGVTLDKRFQRADWSQRPLTAEMVAYAADDTRHLLELRNLLATRLSGLSRMHWAQEEFLRLEDLRWTGGRDDYEAYLRLKGAKGLSPRQRAILRSVYAWREDAARQLDRAPFRVLGNTVLVDIARIAPRRKSSLSRIGGVSSTVQQRYGPAILAAVEQGLATPEEHLPRRSRAKRVIPDPGYETRLDQLKALRNDRAVALGLDPGLVCPNGTLQRIARAAPTSVSDLRGIAELRGWQLEVLGDLAVLEAAHGGDGS